MTLSNSVIGILAECFLKEDQPGSHQNHTGMQSAYLCDFAAHSFKWAATRTGMSNRYCISYICKTSHTRFHGTVVLCYLVPANALHWRSAFGVALTMYWHPEQIAKAVHFERGAGNVYGTHLSGAVFWCAPA